MDIKQKNKWRFRLYMNVQFIGKDTTFKHIEVYADSLNDHKKCIDQLYDSISQRWEKGFWAIDKDLHKDSKYNFRCQFINLKLVKKIDVYLEDISYFDEQKQDYVHYDVDKNVQKEQ